MEIVYDDASLERVMADLTSAHGALAREGGVSATRPILSTASWRVRSRSTSTRCATRSATSIVAGVMEHVEEAGVHSGDSACALPPQTLDAAALAAIDDYTARIANALGVIGPINVQYALKGGELFVLEANPRASRTVPFVAKATGVSLAQVAVRVMMGAYARRAARGGARPGDDPGAATT